MTSAYLVTTLLYLIAGMFTGLISGVLGVGGGIIVVPALLMIFQYNRNVPETLSMPIAAGTSLAVMVFTSLSSIRAHHRRAILRWDIFRRLLVGVVIGVMCGAYFEDKIPTSWLKILLGLFLLFVAFKMVTGSSNDDDKPTHDSFPKNWINQLISFIIGLKSGLLGIGGGALIIPYLRYCGVNMREIAPVSSMCTATVAVIGSIVFMLTGLHVQGIPAFSTGYIHWPAVAALAVPSMICAPLGAVLTYRLPVKKITYIFVIILIATSINLLRS